MQYRIFSVAVSIAIAMGDSAAANVVGSDLQNFNASTSGIDYVTVQSSETLEPGLMNLGLMLNYAVNSLPVFEEQESQNRFRPKDSLLMGDMLIGLGLFRDLEIGLAINHLYRQKVDGGVAGGQFSKPGVINLRYVAKYRLLELPTMGIAAAFSYDQNTVDKNPYLGEGESGIYNIEMIADQAMGQLNVAFNLGYRFRARSEKLDSSALKPTPNQLIGSIGTSLLLPYVDTKLIAEIFGSRPTGPNLVDNAARQASSLEAIIGIKHDFSTNIALHAGGGTEVLNGVSSPDWRFYGGLNWTFGPIFEVNEQEQAVEETGRERKIILYSLHFATGSAQVGSESKQLLDELAANIRKVDKIETIIVEGHTDSVGSSESNQALSERRAEAVRQSLINTYGFEANKVQAVGFGESRPIDDNGNFQGRERNRRVEVRVVKE